MMRNIALTILALCGVWIVIGAAVHHFQGGGLNGVYVAEDGAGDMTFWPNGTYLMNAFGINLPGRYRIRDNGTVDMTAQGDTASNGSQQSQQADPIVSMMARGMDGEVSSDRNTFRWQGHIYSFDHKPTTGPPAVPDPSTAETTAPSSADAPSPMHTPTSQEINQSQAKPGDEFHANTEPDPNVTDPNQISQQQMQQYNAAHPGMAPAQPAASIAQPEPVDTSAPQGVVMPDDNLQQKLKNIEGQGGQ